MCGRFTLTLEASEVQQELGIQIPLENWQPRFNIAPSQSIAVLKNTAASELSWMRWGLIPFWAKDAQIGQRLINARAETIQEKPAFRAAFKSRRCIILADGFFEWRKSSSQNRSQPFYFTVPEEKLFGIAGLWESWSKAPDQESATETCTLITCEANNLVAAVHNRMPVILTGDRINQWLEDTDSAFLQKILRPYPSESMAAWAVSPIVNSPAHDTPECLLPVEE